MIGWVISSFLGWLPPSDGQTNRNSAMAMMMLMVLDQAMLVVSNSIGTLNRVGGRNQSSTGLLLAVLQPTSANMTNDINNRMVDFVLTI